MRSKALIEREPLLRAAERYQQHIEDLVERTTQENLARVPTHERVGFLWRKRVALSDDQRRARALMMASDHWGAINQTHRAWIFHGRSVVRSVTRLCHASSRRYVIGCPDAADLLLEWGES